MIPGPRLRRSSAVAASAPGVYDESGPRATSISILRRNPVLSASRSTHRGEWVGISGPNVAASTTSQDPRRPPQPRAGPSTSRPRPAALGPQLARLRAFLPRRARPSSRSRRSSHTPRRHPHAAVLPREPGDIRRRPQPSPSGTACASPTPPLEPLRWRAPAVCSRAPSEGSPDPPTRRATTGARPIHGAESSQSSRASTRG